MLYLMKTGGRGTTPWLDKDSQPYLVIVLNEPKPEENPQHKTLQN